MDWPDGARAVLHVDMDAFYASIEVRDDPSLRGLPVIVGGPKEARGVVSAASYEARRHGVRSAMPLRTAGRLCPQGVFLPVRMERYAEVSAAIFALLDRFSPLVEPLSVDEAFLDLTGSERLLGGPVAAARAIRAAIAAEFGLTASVGVAPNKFVAKIASDLEKPDALVVVRPDRMRAFLEPLPIERMWGIGPKGAAALRGLGVSTFEQLGRVDAERLRALFGSHAELLRALAEGRDARPVFAGGAPKSVGREVTFPENVSDMETLHATLVRLADSVASRLRGEHLRARCITLKVRYAPFRTLTRQATLPEPVQTTSALLEAAVALFRTKTPGARDPVRLLGLSASRFGAQGLLFTSPREVRGARLEGAVDRVRERFGPAALERGTVLASGRARQRGKGKKDV
ncbi:MAG: DNA polymerase IV [Planctomycetaceae bacterium]